MSFDGSRPESTIATPILSPAQELPPERMPPLSCSPRVSRRTCPLVTSSVLAVTTASIDIRTMDGSWLSTATSDADRAAVKPSSDGCSRCTTRPSIISHRAVARCRPGWVCTMTRTGAAGSPSRRLCSARSSLSDFTLAAMAFARGGAVFSAGPPATPGVPGGPTGGSGVGTTTDRSAAGGTALSGRSPTRLSRVVGARSGIVFRPSNAKWRRPFIGSGSSGGGVGIRSCDGGATATVDSACMNGDTGEASQTAASTVSVQPQNRARRRAGRAIRSRAAGGDVVGLFIVLPSAGPCVRASGSGALDVTDPIVRSRYSEAQS